MDVEVTEAERQRRATSQWMRASFVVIGLAVAVALLAVTLSAWRGARELSQTVTAGQASLLTSSFDQFAGPRQLEPTAEALRGVLDASAGLGLIHVGIYDADGLRLGVGEPLAPVTDAQLRRLFHREDVELEVDGRRVVRTAFPAGPPVGPPPAGALPHGPPPAGTLPRGPPFHFVLEFEPLLADDLRARSNRTLAVGILGAVIVVLASVGFWWLSIQIERSDRRLAQQRQLATLGEMSAVLAHELRNPLASLKGHAQLLEEQLAAAAADGLADDRTLRKASRVVAEARRLEVLGSGLLDFVRLGELERASVAPVDVATAAMADLDAGRVDLDARRAPAQWSLDRVRMQQVLTNLIDNALQVSAPDQRVSVTIEAGRRSCVFRVCDRGPGVPEAERERIFEPFHTTRVRGTGLGLAVSRRIVELHGGTIEVRDRTIEVRDRTIEASDRTESGAVFEVRIPKASP